MKVEDLNIKIFADTVDYHQMEALQSLQYIKGFTTNPSLVRKCYGERIDYKAWATTVLQIIKDKPISFEVLSDDFDEMERQARLIAAWGENVYVKIPITDTKGKSATGVIERLSKDGVKVNVTAVMTQAQVYCATIALLYGAPSIISIFAGRIADTGIDEEIFMCEAKDKLDAAKSIELLWASTREVGNIVAADAVGCDIITVPPDMLGKLHLLGKDLTEFSRETVQQFYDDAQAAGYTL